MSKVTPFPSDRGGVADRFPPAGERGRRLLTPEELVIWLQSNGDALADRWLLEIRSKVERIDGSVEGLLHEFLRLMVDFLPLGVGPYRDQAIPVFHQAAELYGNLGAIRGLAAGEAVEEVQLLREVVLRLLFRDPLGNGGPGLGLRELLQLSRLIDQAVTHASVGHTDSLFFNLFHGTGVPENPTQEVLEEVQAQVGVLRGDLERLRRLEQGEIVTE
jgi:hypothetical protein